MLETLDYTIRIGSTPTFLYFDLYTRIHIYTTKRKKIKNRWLYIYVLITINNSWTRLTIISIIIKADVCVICQGRRMTQTEALIILDILCDNRILELFIYA